MNSAWQTGTDSSGAGVRIWRSPYPPLADPPAPPIFAQETDQPLESPVSPVPVPQGERVGGHED